MDRSQRNRNSPTIEDGDNDSPKSQTEEPTGLQFLTFTHVNQTTDPETKRKVRSHVMHGVQQRLRGGRGKEKGKGKINLDISSLSQPNEGPSNYGLAPPPILQPGTLGSGQSDPFKQYPIEMDIRTHELYDHLHGKTCPMFKTLNRIGFFKTVLDDAAFRQILCTASSHMAHLQCKPQSSEAIVLSSEAIRSINSRISDPVQCLSDGVIITIITFACHSVMFNDRDGVLTHFNGLEELIKRRGGLQVFSSNVVVRTVIFWIDVNSAFLLDRIPRFPIPYDILPAFNVQPLTSLPDQSLLDACISQDLASALKELLTFIQHMKNELAVRDLWDDGVFAGLHLVPLLAKFLSFRHDNIEDNPALAREESCRIAALMYLGGIRQKFGVMLTSEIYVPKLKQAIVSQDKSNPEQIKHLLLWLLLIGGVQSHRHEDHSFFVGALAGAMMRLRCHTWDELLTAVRTVSWVDGIMEKDCDQFHIEVSSELWNSYGLFMS